MAEHLPECPKSGCPACQEIAYAQGLGAGSDEHRQHEIGWAKGYAEGLDTAREAIAETHLPIPVIQCECGWGVNCLECGPESNRIVGFVCRVCCDDWGDHGYCGDMHNEDDLPVHHVGGEMWSGPFCPVLAAIEALRKESQAEQGSGGYSMTLCHHCHEPVAFDTGTWLHLDDRPLCLKEISNESRNLDGLSL